MKSVFTALVFILTISVFPQATQRYIKASSRTPRAPSQDSCIVHKQDFTKSNKHQDANREPLSTKYDRRITGSSAAPYFDVLERSTAGSLREMRNFDWIDFFTSAYHSRFDATVTDTMRNEVEINLWHDIGDRYTASEGRTYWASDSASQSGMLILGPEYRQETRYRRNSKNWYADTVTYIVSFALQMFGEPLNPTAPVCTVFAKCIVKNDSPLPQSIPTDISKYGNSIVLLPGEIGTVILAQKILTAQQIQYDPFQKLWYSLAGFRSSTGLENTTSAKPFVLQSVSFPVEVSGNGRVGISEIEVYDNIVWKRYFSNLHATVNRRALIDLYVKSLTLDTTPRRNAEIKTKWNLIFSCNEPHSIESYDATRIVKEDIKLMNRTEESTRFYPGWNAIIK